MGPRLQVGENQMDDRQVLLGNLWITTLGNSEVLIAALTEASIAAPIVSNDQRSRRDGALDEPTERLGATVEHDGEPNASGIASVFPVVELGARLSMTHLDGTGDGNLVVNTTAFPTVSPVFWRHLRQRRTPGRFSKWNGSPAVPQCGQAKPSPQRAFSR